jgi:hypothetical protein
MFLLITCRLSLVVIHLIGVAPTYPTLHPSRSHVNERRPSLGRRSRLPQRAYCVVQGVCNVVHVDGFSREERLVEALGDERTVVISHGPVVDGQLTLDLNFDRLTTSWQPRSGTRRKASSQPGELPRLHASECL